MKIVNKTRNIVLDDVRILRSRIEFILGLMFRKNGRIIMDFGCDKNIGIWTLFMRFPIDIAFVSSKMKIVKIVRDAKPLTFNPKTWKIYREKNVRYVLETESNALNLWNPGDEVKFIFEEKNKIMEIKEVGRITHYFNKIGVAVVEVSDEIKKGDKIVIKGHTTNLEQIVESMQIEHKSVDVASKGQSIGLKVNDRVREGDKVYKIIE